MKTERRDKKLVIKVKYVQNFAKHWIEEEICDLAALYGTHMLRLSVLGSSVICVAD